MRSGAPNNAAPEPVGTPEPETPGSKPAEAGPETEADAIAAAADVPGIKGKLARAATKPWAVPTLCALSFADACVSPILPEVILVPLVLGRPSKRWRYTAWASLFSVLGGMCGYLLGMLLWENGLREFAYDYIPGFTPEWFDKISTWYGGSTFLWVFLAGFTPLPYKVFTVVAGVCHAEVAFGTFVLASALSRTLRFWLEVKIIHAFGTLKVVSWKWVVLGTLILVLIGVLMWRWTSG